MATRHGVRGARVLATLASTLGLIVLSGAAASAAGPTTGPVASGEPVVFARPQFLVWMEGHQTMDGPVVDRAYWLYTHEPDGDGSHFAVPDGSGGVFHYQGALVGGPFGTDAEACPAMLARGVTSLPAWPPGEYSPVVDCARFQATLTAAAPPTSPLTPTSATAGPTVDPVRVGTALGGVALIVGGAAGLARRGRRPSTSTPPERPSDPCATQLADYHAASARVAVLGDLLQTNRRLEALVDRQVVLLADIVIPGSFGLDVAFILGGQWGSKIGWGFIPKEILAKALDGLIKDVVKEAGKQGIEAAGRSALGLDSMEARLLDAAKKGGEGGTKGLLKEIVKMDLQGRESARVFATASGSPEQLKARLTLLKTYQDTVTNPAADVLGHMMSMYNTGIGVATLMQKLDILRLKRDALLDATAELEMRRETAVEDATTARERLNFCQTINRPDWKP